jgi:hypothetical protein
MAKIKMLCPFSGELCRECAQYRGRHYYLCFYAKYRGYLGTTAADKAKQKSWSSGFSAEFEMPEIFPSPSWLALNEFIERKRK